MRHRNYGGKLGRTSAHRKALLRNLVTSLLEHERIETTDAKAQGAAARRRPHDHARQARRPARAAPGAARDPQPRRDERRSSTSWPSATARGRAATRAC